ncbi:MAG: outer membrane beta-barrel protein [Treponema sp.]|jgi:TolB-like protein|nr:outer membrane beta-barrel protein [Treponema sp.]
MRLRKLFAGCLFLGAGLSLFAQGPARTDGGKQGIAVLTLDSRGLARDEEYLPGLVYDALVRDFSRNSGLEVLDRQNLRKVIAETESGIYRSEANFIRLGEVAHVDYALTGGLTKLPRGFSLTLTVTDTKTGLTVAAHTGACSAAALEDTSAVTKASRELIKQIKAEMRRNADPEAWKHKRVYLGARAGLAAQNPALNTNREDIQAAVKPAFEGAVQGELSLLDFSALKQPVRFSAQTELAFSGETVSAGLPDQNAVTLEAATLTIPLLAKASWRPRRFYLAAFTGPALTLPLGQMKVTRDETTERGDFSPTFGLTAGMNAGMKAGPGVVFLDIRYYGDFLFTRVNGTPQYRRQRVSFSLGYSYGLVTKGVKQ